MDFKEVWHCWNTPTTGTLCGAEGVYLNITGVGLRSDQAWAEGVGL